MQLHLIGGVLPPPNPETKSQPTQSVKSRNQSKQEVEIPNLQNTSLHDSFFQQNNTLNNTLGKTNINENNSPESKTLQEIQQNIPIQEVKFHILPSERIEINLKDEKIRLSPSVKNTFS